LKTSFLNPVAVGIVVILLAGCGKDIPSCGDIETTSLVSQLLVGKVTKDAGPLEKDFKKRVHFEVEQPVVLAHDEKISRYSCKAVGTYKVPDGVLEKLQRSINDKTYQTKLWGNWRKLTGLYSYEDLKTLATELNDPATTSESEKQKIHEELVEVMNIDKNMDNKMIATIIELFPLNRENVKIFQQRANQINANAALLQKVLELADDATKKIPVEIQYTISKIDGAEKKFRVEVKSEQGRVFEGIQYIETLVTAAQIAEQPVVKEAKPAAQVQPVATAPAAAPVQQAMTDPAAIQSQPTSMQPATAVAPPTSSPVQEPQPTVQPSSEVKPQTVTPPEPKNALIEASFDCSKASAKIEKLICSTSDTANADKRLAVAYGAAKTKSSDDQKLKNEQITWMKQQRNNCEDAACLVKAIDERIGTLSR